MSDWRARAACRDHDPEIWFPVGASGPALLQAEQAKAVCRRCSVIDQCLRWALDRPEEFGIWGGLTEDERRALRTPKASPQRDVAGAAPGRLAGPADRPGGHGAGRPTAGGAAGVGGGGMTPQEIRELLAERFGSLEELERERRRLSPAQEIARRRRLLAEAMGDVPRRAR